jgi:hypothetical protein
MPEAKETAGQIEYYSRAMKAPRIREAAARLADQVRETGWTHEEYLAAVLSREVAAREASGAEMRARAAGFPARKSLEDFSFDHQPGIKRDTIAHLATGAFLTEASNIVLLGPPYTPVGKSPCTQRYGRQIGKSDANERDQESMPIGKEIWVSFGQRVSTRPSVAARFVRCTSSVAVSVAALRSLAEPGMRHGPDRTQAQPELQVPSLLPAQAPAVRRSS